MIDLLYDGTVPPSDSWAAAPAVGSVAVAPDSRAARAARAWCPRCCASAMASDSVIALEESGSAVWTASVGDTNAPRRGPG